ncbi:MAG: serine/threonine protein kinase [Deltaproteobacteria bacterium]|nr:serine/threonine protein kinase [Deltaproteobacteria bacterium]
MSELTPSTLRAGTVISGKYEIIRCLGSGSMGVVYSARVIGGKDGKIYALKVLYPEVARNPALSARFRNEVLVAYGVNHPNVVRAYEYIRDGDLIAYSMEYLDGGDLADRLSNWHKEPILYELGLKWMWQMAAGLQAIHDAGIIHRDLKPENILMTSTDDVKIADFGIAKAQHGPRLTEHGGVVGTINYVSPEYILNGTIDKRSDIYAFGLLAFEIFTGTQPFNQGSMFDLMTTRIKIDPPDPRTFNSRISVDLSNLILKCLKRNPDERYQTMEEILTDLANIFEKENLNMGDLTKLSGKTSEIKVFGDLSLPSGRQPVITERDPFAFGSVGIDSDRTQAVMFNNQEIAKQNVKLEKLVETKVGDQVTRPLLPDNLVNLLVYLVSMLLGVLAGRAFLAFFGII